MLITRLFFWWLSSVPAVAGVEITAVRGRAAGLTAVAGGSARLVAIVGEA